ncbi:phosphopantetheine-binding protein [Flavobacterium sp. KMS]|jgi:acyl carrier protein|uniref:phosphopantetheine-binding protein n=1 Tax=unclassified Flavobacterium TaxID=196869 RepID=UPI00057DA08C|nr:phosphopantetheine-binding protein [Flavobacterium sp. KMS]KIA99832.1 acyl carrier protein [Flavobacterium sp. KMS]
MNDKIISILNDIRPEFDFNEPTENFIEAGMLDSFDLVTLVTSLDESFEISIDGTDILPENFANVETISSLLIKYIK